MMLYYVLGDDPKGGSSLPEGLLYPPHHRDGGTQCACQHEPEEREEEGAFSRHSYVSS